MSVHLYRKGSTTEAFLSCCEGSPEATWGNLIELLDVSEQKELAEQVKDALAL